MLTRPVFVLGVHKSGTSLLRSLLDGTPALAVLPKESHFFERLGLGVAYPLRSAPPGPATEADLLERASAALSVEPSDANPFSDSPGFGGYDVDRFRQSWRSGATTIAGLYGTYVQALWSAATAQPLEGLRIVDKCVSYLEYGELLAHAFPDASLIQIVRNPYATLVAYRRYRQAHSGAYPDVRLIGQALRYGYYWNARLRRTVPGFTSIRYEDLVADPGPTMRSVARAVGVTYRESMLRPTLLGAQWEGNSSFGTAFTGVSREGLEAWREDITPAEAYTVNRSLPACFWTDLGYEELRIPRRRALRPSRGERVRDYLRLRT